MLGLLVCVRATVPAAWAGLLRASSWKELHAWQRTCDPTSPYWLCDPACRSWSSMKVMPCTCWRLTCCWVLQQQQVVLELASQLAAQQQSAHSMPQLSPSPALPYPGGMTSVDYPGMGAMQLRLGYLPTGVPGMMPRGGAANVMMEGTPVYGMQQPQPVAPAVQGSLGSPLLHAPQQQHIMAPPRPQWQ